MNVTSIPIAKQGYKKLEDELARLKSERPAIIQAIKEAREEGFEKIALLFDMVGKIEKEHEERYRKLLANIENGLVFSRDGDMIWECSNCGHIVIGKKAPEICPVCSHAQSYFQLRAQNY